MMRSWDPSEPCYSSAGIGTLLGAVARRQRWASLRLGVVEAPASLLACRGGFAHPVALVAAVVVAERHWHNMACLLQMDRRVDVHIIDSRAIRVSSGSWPRYVRIAHM